MTRIAGSILILTGTGSVIFGLMLRHPFPQVLGAVELLIGAYYVWRGERPT